MPDRLRVATFNCRSVKSSLHYVLSLCESHDIVCIQEHWTHELSLLHLADISSDVLVGRPYGGTAILDRKSLAHVFNILPSSKLSTTGINISKSDGPLRFLTVCMPTEYNDDECLGKYIDVCAHLNAIITDSCTPHSWGF
jgi:exonuclease III